MVWLQWQAENLLMSQTDSNRSFREGIMKNKKLSGILAVIIAALLIASFSIFSRYLNTKFLLFQQIYLRIGVASIGTMFLFGKHIDYSKFKKISLQEWGLIIFRGIAFFVINIAFITEAFITTRVSNVAFIMALPLSALFGFLLFHEKVTVQRVLFISLAFIGVILISVTDFSHIFNWGRGEVLALIGTTFFALGLVSRKWHSELLNDYEITFLTLSVGFLVMLVLSFVHGDGVPVSNWNPVVVLVILITGLFNIMITFLLNYGYEVMAAVVANNLLMLQAVFTTILGVLFYAEFPTIQGLIGGALIIISAIAINIHIHRQAKLNDTTLVQ
jgi:drug/metabolite transporter (DMT)-like permease